MIKKEQFNNICPSTMEYCRARGCIFTKNFPCFILTKCLTPPERRKRPLGLTATDRKCFYYYWWIRLGILKNIFPAKLRLDLLEWLCSLSSPGCSCIVQVRSRRVKDLEVKTDKTRSLKVYSWDQPGYEKLFSLVTSKQHDRSCCLIVISVF